MRVMFFGTGTFAVPSLEQLVAHRYAVELCVTRPDKPQGRGLKPEPSPVQQTAERLGLPVTQPERPNASLCEGRRVDIGVVADYGQLLCGDVLRRPAHGMLGVHPSLLPKYRGAAPVAWAILNGESCTGVTIFRLDERLDAGDIVVQREVPIEPGEDAQRLTERLAQISAEELVRSLGLIESGEARFSPQDEAHASLAPKLTKSQGQIDWTAPAEAIERLVLGTVPWPGATTTWGGQPLKVWSVGIDRSASGRADRPGTVMGCGSEGIRVATGRGALVIKELQPAGRRRMSAKEFLAGHPVQTGELFGA